MQYLPIRYVICKENFTTLYVKIISSNTRLTKQKRINIHNSYVSRALKQR